MRRFESSVTVRGLHFLSMITMSLSMTSALLGCATTSSRVSPLAISSQHNIAHDSSNYATNLAAIHRYFDALNRRDLLALTAYVTPDLEWYSVVKGQRILEVQGREALAKMLRQYFGAHQRTQWTLKEAQGVADILAIKERSEWTEGAQMQARDSIAVYELIDGRIRRITYFLQDE